MFSTLSRYTTSTCSEQTVHIMSAHNNIVYKMFGVVLKRMPMWSSWKK